MTAHAMRWKIGRNSRHPRLRDLIGRFRSRGNASMNILVLVHGTGVRKKGYDDTLAVIREQVAHRPDVRGAECRWGEAHGCQLYAGGASVPTYDATRAL